MAHPNARVAAAAAAAAQVVLLDRKLGILHTTCILLVLAYVIGYNVVHNEQYLLEERSFGNVGISLNGTTYSVRPLPGAEGGEETMPQDVASLVQVDDPAGGGAPGNALFLPTRWITSYDQRIGVCGDPNAPCDHEDNACPAEKPMLPGMCNGSPSLCTRKQWCNPGTCQGVLADPFLSPETSANAETLIELTNPRRLYVTLTAQIAFPELYSADAGEHGTMHLEDGRHARVRWDLDTILTRAGLSEEDAVGCRTPAPRPARAPAPPPFSLTPLAH